MLKTLVFGVADSFGSKDEAPYSAVFPTRARCLLYCCSRPPFLGHKHGHTEVKTQLAACKAKIVSIWNGAEVAKAHSQPSHISPETISVFLPRFLPLTPHQLS